MRGRYDDAAGDLRDGRRVIGDTTDVQFTQPCRYLDAMIALGRGDLAAAREAVAAGAGRRHDAWAARYAWPLLWLGMRSRPTRPPGPATGAQDVPAEIARALRAAGRPRRRSCTTPAPPWRGYRALVAAEQARAAGDGEAAAWSAAAAAWRARGRAVPAGLRAAAAGRGARRRGDRRGDAEAVREAHALAARIGAAPIAAEAAALARRARLSLDARRPRRGRDGRRRPPAARPTSWPGSGSPSASARCWSGWPPAGPTRRSPGAVHQRQDGQRARVQHPGQAGRQRPGRGRRGRAPAGHRAALTG